MDDNAKLKILQKRRREILLKLENCQKEMARCHDNLRRLHEEEEAILLGKSELPAAPAQRTKGGFDFSDLSKPGGPERSSEPNAASIDFDNPNRGKGTPHPKDAPSIASMVQQILWEVRTTQPDGLTGRELVKKINDKWWPGVSQNSIWPKLYKLEKQRLIRRKFDRWVLVR